MKNSSFKKQSGFTLVELSVVLIISSIILSGAISVGTAQLENARINSTQQKEVAIKKALLTFMSRNKRLPCPAIATLASTAANYGVEALTPGTCTGTTQFVAGINRNARGIIPWTTLGIADDDALDAFGRRFTYQVLLSQTATNAVSGAGIKGNINILNAAGGTSINPSDPAAAIIISHGNNGYGAYLSDTGNRMAIAPGSAADSRENTDNDLDFVIKDYSNDPQYPFDDIVSWLKPSEINASLAEVGVLTPPNITVNQNITSIRNALLAAMSADNNDPDGGGARVLGRRMPFADCTGTPNGTADNNCTNGVVPWATLGIAQSIAQDPWNNYINLTLTSTLASSGVSQTSPAAGSANIVITAAGADGLIGTADDTSLSMGVTELRGALLSASVTLDP